jgi:DnaA family protein
MSRQLALGLTLQPAFSFDSFIPGPNGEALDAVRRLAAGAGEPYLYLWGPAGVGKSHLLQAACGAAHAPERPVAYLPLTQALHFGPDLLQDLETMTLVCLDDLHCLAGQALWEEALFDLYNRIREADAGLLVSADRPLAQLPTGLPDLASRLAWGPSYQLQPLPDAELLTALTRLAAERGLRLPADSAQYILRRCPRDLGYLQGLLERLDRASLAAQRRLTLPFVREQLRQRE